MLLNQFVCQVYFFATKCYLEQGDLKLVPVRGEKDSQLLGRWTWLWLDFKVKYKCRLQLLQNRTISELFPKTPWCKTARRYKSSLGLYTRYSKERLYCALTVLIRTRPKQYQASQFSTYYVRAWLFLLISTRLIFVIPLSSNTSCLHHNFLFYD